MTNATQSTASAAARDLESAVQFPTPTRLHVAIAVKDVERSLPFYRTLFAQEPTKVRPGYAKFEVLDPPVNFTLNAGDWPAIEQGPRHFGVQVKSTAAVLEAKVRIEAAGFSTWTEEQVSCCYAVQDKVWASDPDGHRWEIFVVTNADAEHYERIPAQATGADAESDCCAPRSCDDASADENARRPEEAAAKEPPCCAPSCCS